MPAPALASAAPGVPPAMTAADVAPRPRLGRALGAAAAAGAGQGALLYGGGVSLLHVLHNRPGLGDALALLAWGLLLYGAWAAVAALVAMFAWRALAVPLGSRLGHRARSPEAEPAGDASRAVSDPRSPRARRREVRDLWAATAPFHVVFWVLAASYGLTYDESPGWVSAAPQMALWLLLRSLVVAAAALAVAWALVRATVAARRGGRLPLLLVGFAAALLAAHAGAALLRPAVVRPAVPLPATAPTAASAAKVALVAIDGADWRVIQPLLDAGRMPNLARLVDEGAAGPLATLPDSNSAVIWASIYTGRGPEDHGILDFYTLRLPGMRSGVYPVHRTFFKELVLRLQAVGIAELVTIDRSRVGAPLLWEVTQARGRSLGLVDGYFYSYPAPAAVGPGSYYVAYGADTAWPTARYRERGGPPLSTAARYAAPPELLAELGELLGQPDFTWQSESLLALLGSHGQPDLVALYTHEPDAVQHASWRHLEPERYFGAERGPQPDPVVGFHLAFDAYLGRLRERLAPGTVLVIASDHGHSATLAHSMDTQHRHGPPGILVVHGPGVRRMRLERAHVLDLFPTILHLLGVPVPEDGDGRVLTEALAPAALARNPVRTVPSWDGVARPAAAAAADADRRDEELEKLKSLGYIR